MHARIVTSLVMMLAVPGMAIAGGGSITGTATWRERMVLPPAAVFEATLEDISRADAPATVLGRARIENPGNPPLRFRIDYDPAVVDARHRYAVRATITVDGRLMFTTDTVQSVFGPEQATQGELLLKRVGASPSPAPSASDGTGGRFRGAFKYFADAGVFTLCATGQKLPVAQEGDNVALQAAYLKARAEAGAPVLAAVEGRIEMREPMEGPARPTLIVERFIEVLPGEGCEVLAGRATLENTYWRLASLRGRPVPPVANQQREPHLILQPAQKRVAGSGGCNRLMGSYALEGARLSFSPMAGTMMACPQGMETERALLDGLATVARWQIDSQRLELLDAQGGIVAEFEARYLK
jgi:uncharacterized lipoprotein YbaY/heat shock protein HslJ